MNRSIAASLVAASVIAGVGAGFAARQLDGGSASAADPGTTVTSSPAPTATSPAPSATEDPDLAAARADRTGPSWSPADPVDAEGRPITVGDVVPGAIEPIRVGTPVDEAIATGLIERDDSGLVCEGTRYRWTGDLGDGFDVQVRQDGTIATLGLFKDGAETAKGISVGNSYGGLRRAYGGALSEPEEAGYSQTGAFVREDTRWIGFLFDEAPDRLTDSSRITMVEVTDGNQPDLMRDGC
ncbi:hypothetical protein IDH50_04775 [Aeromicrobium tamlense]|uniref:Uncharacterized protein n=1 Tax=Aeromicrobium tamlense TaxID=375541 RepID=A0A8I0FSX7_9ACTN|nr:MULTISPECIES: hypothetical protein [Aeromicrobium]MBD1269537.1 hypothetical protein [Aeromicrobium tamlense]NYI39809.1 hypothetical protein [Aeromicrobium tamlense]